MEELTELRAREDLVEETAHRLRLHSFPRLQMSALLALTGAAGFLSSFVLLRLGVDSMALRYPVAVALAYGAFLLLLRIWLDLQRDGWMGFFARGLDGLDGADLIPGDVPFHGHGHGFGGGGKGSSFNLSFDLDESAVLVLLAVLILAVTALGTVLWILWIAPSLLAEVLVDGLLMKALYRRLREHHPTGWLPGAVRRTCVPALIAAALLSFAGLLLHGAVPGARALGAAWRAVSAEQAEAR